MIDFCFSCLTIINIMDNNVSTESNCIIEAVRAVQWPRMLVLWASRGIASISLMEHNYAGSDTDWLATHNRQYLGRGNLTNNQSNQQLSTLQLQHYGENEQTTYTYLEVVLIQFIFRNKIPQKCLFDFNSNNS